MTRARQRRTKRAAPQGAWLAFLALAIQILLPFLVADEIALASTPAYAEGTTIICSATSHQSDHAAHHGTLDHPCPLCDALAASHAFTAAGPVALPLPRSEAIVFRITASETRAVRNFAASYQSRAPPAIA